MRKPQLHWLTADWRGFVEPAATAEDKVPSPETILLHNHRFNQLGTNMVISGADAASPGVETPIPPLIADRPGFGEPAAPGEDRVPPPNHQHFHTSTNPTNTGTKTVICGGNTVAHGMETPTPLVDR